MKAPADERFLRDFRSGKEDAMKKLYNSYSRDLVFFSLKITGNREESEDIVAEGFIKAWEKRSSFTGFPAIKGFLVTDIKNRSIDYYRKKKGHAEKHAEILKSSDETIYNEYLRAEMLQDLNELLKLLTPSQREIVTETLIEGASAQDIANQLQMSLGNLYKERSKALEVMHKKISEQKMDYPYFVLYLLILTELARPSSN